MSTPLHIVLRCADAIEPKVRYVLDTLLMARGIPVAYSSQPPAGGPWLLYAPTKEAACTHERCLAIAHSPDAWRLFSRSLDVETATSVEALVAVFPERAAGFDPETDISFDIVANAFYFLSSWSERLEAGRAQTRGMYANSVFARLGVPQDIVDRYLDRIETKLRALCDRAGLAPWKPLAWPDGSEFALVLSHDVDFIPAGLGDTLVQGAKTMIRHLVRQRDPDDALRSHGGPRTRPADRTRRVRLHPRHHREGKRPRIAGVVPGGRCATGTRTTSTTGSRTTGSATTCG